MDEFQEGIVFGMPEDEYHAVPALSSSGVKNIHMSPMDFWARASWLNPTYDVDNATGEDSVARMLGRAYHKRILEGRDAFYREYAIRFDPTLYPEALDGAKAIQGRLRELKEAGADVKLTGDKAELTERLLAIEPEARIMDRIKAEYEDLHEGKTLLAEDVLDRIELAAAMIERSPTLQKAFTGGHPEVSVFWLDLPSGVQCKARFDYLKPKAIVDLKTFANKSGYPAHRAIERELAYNRYPIQAAWYYDASEQLARLVTERKAYDYDDGSWQPVDNPLTRQLQLQHEKTFIYIFQQKGIAPIALGRSLPRDSSHLLVAKARCESARFAYRDYFERYGKDPWITADPIEAFDDAGIPALWE